MRYLCALLLFISLPFVAHALIAAPEVPNKVFNTRKILNIQDLKTDSGIDIWLVEDHSVPLVSISFSMVGGLSADPRDKAGLSYLMSILMDEGAGDYTAQDFQKKISDLSTSLGFSADRDFFTGSLKSLTENLNESVQLANLAMTNPRFDEDAIKRMKQIMETTINSNMKSPSWIAARSFNGIVFDGDAYALPGRGTLSAIKVITKEDLHAQHKKQFNIQDLKVAIAGDITAKDAQKLVENLFAGLAKKREFTLPKQKAKLKGTGKTYHYEYDNPQTHILLGHKGIDITDPNWPAVQIVNYVLGGGGFDSRLMNEIREKRGLSYNVGSYVLSMKRASVMQATLATSNKNTKEALDLLKAEWARMATTGPTQKEIQNAKSHLTGSLLLSLTSTDSIANALAGLQQYGFDADYINRRNQRLVDVTPEHARQVAGRLLTPEDLTIVMVGPAPKDIEVHTYLKTIIGMEPAE